MAFFLCSLTFFLKVVEAFAYLDQAEFIVIFLFPVRSELTVLHFLSFFYQGNVLLSLSL